jgi:hypothetical protein
VRLGISVRNNSTERLNTIGSVHLEGELQVRRSTMPTRLLT